MSTSGLAYSLAVYTTTTGVGGGVRGHKYFTQRFTPKKMSTSTLERVCLHRFRLGPLVKLTFSPSDILSSFSSFHPVLLLQALRRLLLPASCPFISSSLFFLFFLPLLFMLFCIPLVQCLRVCMCMSICMCMCVKTFL